MNSGDHRSSQIQALDSRGSQQAAALTNLSSSVRRTAAAIRPLLLFAIAYALAYQYTGGFGESMPSPLWLPDSVLLCALLLVPGRLWALYLVTALAIRIIHGGVPLWFLTATYLNDCLKAAFSASILKRFIRGPVRLDNLKQFGIYIVTAVVGIPVLSALAG